MLYWRAFLALVTIGILYLSLTPSPPSDGLGWDKLNHAAAMSLGVLARIMRHCTFSGMDGSAG